MPDSGSAPTKTFIRSDGTRTGADLFAQEQAAAINIIAANLDFEAQEMAVALTNRRMLDGGNQPSTDLPMNSFKHTGVAVATARTNYAAMSQVQDSTALYAGTSAGTDIITATLSPAITAYVTGQRYHFKAGGTNTGAATLNLNSVGAKDIKKGAAGSTALGAGDITSGGTYTVEYDGTNMQLVSPGLARNVSAFAATILDDADASAVRTTLSLNNVTNAAQLAIANNLSDVASAATAFGNIKQAASTSATGVVQLADAIAMEALTSGRAVTADIQHLHPSAAKFWAMATVAAGVPTLQTSYNVTSITDTGSGQLTVTIATDFSSANWCASVTVEYEAGDASGKIGGISNGGLAVGTILARSMQTGASSNATLSDPASWHIMGLGDQV